MDLDVVKRIRSQFSSLREDIDQRGADPLSVPSQTYVPISHARALDIEATLVEGIRGSGKSFWWAALASGKHREFLEKAFANSFRIDKSVDIVQGFGADLDPLKAPTSDAIGKLRSSYPPRAIWRAVVATHLGFGAPFPTDSQGQAEIWGQRIAWVHQNPETFDELLWKADQKLDQNSKTRLILFDALDRLAHVWDDIRPLAQGLLQVALEMRSTRRVRLKLFVRPDMLEDRGITNFPDFSKLNAGKASLEWKRADLYALVFQRVGNPKHSDSEFRDFVNKVTGLSWADLGDGSWVLPGKLAREEEIQEKVFIALAGGAMGQGKSGHKRGKPYTWLANHLQDGRDQVSPRSFLSALGEAAYGTEEDYSLVLSAKAIQAGVQRASSIRVDEFKNEDYPWIDTLMESLRGRLTVPCQVEDVLKIWREKNVLGKLKEELNVSQSNVKLPPRHLDQGGRGVLEDLQSLGLFQLQDNERVQMPDVYRIAFGLGRRGGVKPLR